MNQIITIGREFGSGGRELGKRLADILGIAYYDKEIVEEIAKRTQLAESYVHQIVEQRPGVCYPITIGRTLHAQGTDYLLKQHTGVYAEKATVIREMAEKSSCVIVGRCADYILQEKKPFRLFVYADMESKVARCRAKAEIDESLTDRQLIKQIKQVDKNRAKYYEYYTSQRWGARENYDLCVNTSSVDIKTLAEAIAKLLS